MATPEPRIDSPELPPVDDSAGWAAADRRGPMLSVVPQPIAPKDRLLDTVGWEQKVDPDKIDEIIGVGEKSLEAEPVEVVPPLDAVTKVTPIRPEIDSQPTAVDVQVERKDYRSLPRPIHAAKSLFQGGREQPIVEPEVEDTTEWPEETGIMRELREREQEGQAAVDRNLVEQKQQRLENERQRVAEWKEQRKQEFLSEVRHARADITRAEEKIDKALDRLLNEISDGIEYAAPKVAKGSKIASREAWKASKWAAKHGAEASKKGVEKGREAFRKRRNKKEEADALHERMLGSKRPGKDGKLPKKIEVRADSDHDLSPEELDDWFKKRDKHSDPDDPYYYATHAVEPTRENYEAYLARNSETDDMKQLSFEDWVDWQNELAARAGITATTPPPPRVPAPGQPPYGPHPVVPPPGTGRRAPVPPPPVPPVPPSPPAPRGPGAPGGPGNNPNQGPSSRSPLDRATDDLARFTILRRGRSFDLVFGRGDRLAYNQAYEIYEQQKLAHLIQRRDAMRQAANLTEDEIVEELARNEYELQRKFAERVRAIDQENYDQSIQAGGLRAAKAKFLRRVANMSWKKKLFIGLAVGGGAAIASATLGLGLFGLAVGVGARYSLSMVNHSATIRNRFQVEHNQELGRIRRQETREITRRRRSLLRLGGPGAADTDQYLHGMHDRLRHYHRGERVRAQRKNRIGLAIMGASLALAGVGGAELAGIHLPYVGGVEKEAHHLWERGEHFIGSHTPGHHVGPGIHHNTAPIAGGHYETLSISHGNWHDTIWRHVQDHSQPGQDLRANVQKVLNMNRQAILSDSATHGYHGSNLWEASRHLSQGFKFRVPARY